MWRKIGYSSVIPLAPSRSRARRATSRAISALLRLIIDTWTWLSRPASLSRVACSVMNCAFVISLIIHASSL